MSGSRCPSAGRRLRAYAPAAQVWSNQNSPLIVGRDGARRPLPVAVDVAGQTRTRRPVQIGACRPCLRSSYTAVAVDVLELEAVDRALRIARCRTSATQGRRRSPSCGSTSGSSIAAPSCQTKASRMLPPRGPARSRMACPSSALSQSGTDPNHLADRILAPGHRSGEPELAVRIVGRCRRAGRAVRRPSTSPSTRARRGTCSDRTPVAIGKSSRGVVLAVGVVRPRT